jgi:hypothetical protein
VAVFVINEWLWHDVVGDNGESAMREALKVIEALSLDHQIVVIEGSPFDQKAFASYQHKNMISARLAGLYVRDIRQNSDRCIVIRPAEAAEFPEALTSSVKPDDRYLVQALLSMPGSTLVTTDRDLFDAVRGAGLSCLSRNEFIENILHRDDPTY